MEGANDGRVSAVDGPHDTTFGTPVWSHILDIDQHQVPVHGIADLVRRDKDVSGEFGFQSRRQRFRIRNHKAEAVAVHGEPSGD